ncbi:hypothetical protein [Lichenibacterium dinghuense]|uniref:hypothetical protein n=1 Tax=Lichenibacterium dinghuense TaxID=2895977 RepID=UPI001F41FD3E|nr:hypothetical protein [Lichenibacterium sp. 6Y81]
MRFLRLTQANTGVTIHVNMDQVVVIAPNKTGGAVLLTTAVEKDSARIVPVKETPQEVMALLDGALAKA